ncbi:MAG: FAD:protein FMN transferase [Tannerellaceae bacterium]|jgi:thiamine biosynthesis lipoprotein|nr:FAD:protein FMN transferase [Tannerellaceae bacterium]
MRTVFLVVATLLLTGCQVRKHYYEESGTVFNTSYHIKYQTDRSLTQEIDSAFEALNRSFNPFLSSSYIARINRNESDLTDVHLRHILSRSLEISCLSDGIFDVTVAPLINLWGFGYQRHDTITKEAIDSILQFVGYQKIHLDVGGRIHKTDPRVQLNCSAIAKGYAADVIATLLRQHGADNYMVEIGGEVAVQGLNPQHQPWRIGIRKPSDDFGENGLQEILAVSKRCGIATSGDYLNYYRQGDRKVAHTINPKTGYPSEENILSSTVIASDALTADALATTFNALGLEQALSLAESLVTDTLFAPIGYFFIYADSIGTLHTHTRGCGYYVQK